MPKIVRYNGNLKAFASEQLTNERTLFGEVAVANDLTSQINPQFLRGWGIIGPSDQPSLQDFNAAMYTNGQLLAYLHQMGVAEYNAAQEYYIGSVTQYSGAIYISLQDSNIGNQPSANPESWKALVAQATESVAGVMPIATQAEVNTGTNDTKAVTAKKLADKLVSLYSQATESVLGIAKISTQALTNAGADDTTIVTPKKLTAWSAFLLATESVLGFVKLSTQAQTNAGADDTTAVTPKKLRFGVILIQAQRGCLVLPSWLGGITFQWGLESAPGTYNLPTAFTAAYVGGAWSQIVGNFASVTFLGNTTLTLAGTGTTQSFTWFAVGRV